MQLSIWHWPILKVKVNIMVKIMHISIANVLQMLTDRANIATANKYTISYDLSIGIFTFDFGSY